MSSAIGVLIYLTLLKFKTFVYSIKDILFTSLNSLIITKAGIILSFALRQLWLDVIAHLFYCAVLVSATSFLLISNVINFELSFHKSFPWKDEYKIKWFYIICENKLIFYKYSWKINCFLFFNLLYFVCFFYLSLCRKANYWFPGFLCCHCISSWIVKLLKE